MSDDNTSTKVVKATGKAVGGFDHFTLLDLLTKPVKERPEGWAGESIEKALVKYCVAGAPSLLAVYETLEKKSWDYALPFWYLRDVWRKREENKGKTDMAFIKAFFDKKCPQNQRQAQIESRAYRMIINNLMPLAKRMLDAEDARKARLGRLKTGAEILTVDVAADLARDGAVSPATIQKLKTELFSPVHDVPVLSEVPAPLKAILENPSDVESAKAAMKIAGTLMQQAEVPTYAPQKERKGGGAGTRRDPMAVAFGAAMAKFYRAKVDGMLIHDVFKQFQAELWIALGRKEGDRDATWTLINKQYEAQRQGQVLAEPTKTVPAAATNVTPAKADSPVTPATPAKKTA